MNSQLCPHTPDMFDSEPQQPPQPPQAAIRELQAQAFAYAEQIHARAIKGGSVLSVHCYTDAHGRPVYWKTRAKDHSTLKKEMRAFCVNDGRVNEKTGKPSQDQFIGFEPNFSTVYPTGNGKKPLYRLHEVTQADAGQAVWVVEGEQKADYLAELGLIATTSGGASSTNTTDWRPLAGRKVIIWRDNDNPSIKYQSEIAAILSGLQCDPWAIDIEPLNLPEHGDVIDFVRMRAEDGEDTTAADVMALPRTKLEPAQPQIEDGQPATDAGDGMAFDPWPEPEPLGGVEQPAPVYPIEAFPAVAREAIQAIAGHVQAPIGLAGQCVLGTLAYIAQIHVNAPDRHKPEGMPCSLFILSEGASGDRKSACHDLADKVIKERERLMQEEYNDDLKAYFSASHDPKDKQDKPQPPRNPRAIFTDATIESIVSAFVSGDIKNGAWISDEGGHFFGGATMKGDTMKNALGVLVKFFDKGIADRSRSKSNENGSGTVYDVRLMFNLLGQREVLQEALTSPVLRGQGFLPRFIFAASQSLAGDRPESRETLSRKTYADPRLQRFWQHVGSLLPDPTDPISMQQFRDIEANPRPVLELDDAAIDVWLDFYNHTERLQKSEGKYEYMRAFAGRAGELARRVATVFACFEGKTLIDETAMRGACAVVQYSLDEWLRYADATQVSVADQQAQRLETWLISECRKQGVTMLSRAHVMHFCPIAALRKAKALNAALKPLCDANRVRGEMHGRKQMIAVNPDLFS
jgi:hypothetical protein